MPGAFCPVTLGVDRSPKTVRMMAGQLVVINTHGHFVRAVITHTMQADHGRIHLSTLNECEHLFNLMASR